MGWLYVYAQRTDLKVFQGPTARLIWAEESSEALAGSSRWADPRDWLHPGTWRASSAPSLPNTANIAPVQWPRLLSMNWLPGAHRHCRSLRLITLFDYCNTIIIHFLLCMLYLSVFMLYSAATVSIEHRQLYPKEGCKGKGSGEIYVALGNLGAKMWNKCEVMPNKWHSTFV